MAQQLWFLRHGDAEQGSGPDFDRKLTDKGGQQATAAGEALARLGVSFAACYTSPRVRALDTALLACRPLGLGPEQIPALGGGFDRDQALELLRHHGADERVLLVGHEPDFSQAVFDLTGGRVDLKKGGLAAVRVEPSGGTLLVLLRPRELASLAASGSRAAQPGAIADPAGKVSG
ncbi:MAG TPA: phosphoglycerate mutase family protein [Actinomycetes bacterium]|nr:phosphoglycerate mutase family protein [Actinomycetes bacterium]